MNCLHCGGDGVEPFSEEDCSICLGEGGVPEEMNREYYEIVKGALDENDS